MSSHAVLIAEIADLKEQLKRMSAQLEQTSAACRALVAQLKTEWAPEALLSLEQAHVRAEEQTERVRDLKRALMRCLESLQEAMVDHRFDVAYRREEAMRAARAALERVNEGSKQ